MGRLSMYVRIYPVSFYYIIQHFILTFYCITFAAAVEVPTTGATDVTKPIDNKPKPASGTITEPIHGILVGFLCKEMSCSMV
ncbi:hypothetical protein Hdeb2414_s0039g00735591 [Helianthus debilis subsp. tardiflorus]